MCECCKCESMKVDSEKLRLMIGRKLAEWSDDPKSEYKSESVPLLVITVEDADSVPEIQYKGDSLSFKTFVKYEWQTSNEHIDSGINSFQVEHYDEEMKKFVTNGYRNLI